MTIYDDPNSTCMSPKYPLHTTQFALSIPFPHLCCSPEADVGTQALATPILN